MEHVASQRVPGTYEELRKAPADVVAELIDGFLFRSPRHRAAHLKVAHEFEFRLTAAFEKSIGGPGGWVFRAEPEIHLFSDILVPDLAGWKAGRMQREGLETAFYSTVPDFVLEVLSPSTASLDRTRKLPLYARAGVAHVWLVDPIERTVEAYFTRDGLWGLAAEALRDGPKSLKLPPFDAVELDLASAWIEPAVP